MEKAFLLTKDVEHHVVDQKSLERRATCASIHIGDIRNVKVRILNDDNWMIGE